MSEGGSLPALVKAEDGHVYVVKLRGAAQGLQPLAAEIIAGEIARILRLNVPRIALVEITADFSEGEQDHEIHRLLSWSTGTNVGLEFVSGATMFDPAAEETMQAEMASQIVWFDMFVLNVDRTVKNPNLLQANGQFWLIDHGAALYFHYKWENLEQNIGDQLPGLENHVLLPFASDLTAADAAAHDLLSPQIFEQVVSLVPDDLFRQGDGFPSIQEQRSLYVTYLAGRLQRSVNFNQAVRLAQNTL